MEATSIWHWIALLAICFLLFGTKYLRKKGISSGLREAVPAVGGKNDAVFICYRRSDSAYATDAIYEKLRHLRQDLRIFRDIDSIPYASDFRAHISKSLGNCKCCIVVMGRQWLDTTDSSGKRRIDDPSDHVRIEVELALRGKIRVLPVFTDGAVAPPPGSLPKSIEQLSYLNGISVRSGVDFANDIQRLAKIL